MTVEICPYFNDHQTACCLMLDDLLPIAVTVNGKATASNDWGFLRDTKGSLYEYLNRYLLEKYPEIRGTIFLPIASHNFIPDDHGYTILRGEIDPDFVSYLKRIGSRFEMAFHGIKHSWQDTNNQIHYEFAEPNLDILSTLKTIENFKHSTGITFSGGKFPGYRYQPMALELLSQGSFTWWALNIEMINRVTEQNKIIWNEKQQTVLIPTNISGDIFKSHSWLSARTRILSLLLKPWKKSHPVDYLGYLYENRHPITIQEHFQNQTTNGSRQPLNVYDDLWSLETMYGLLRGLDIWHASCGEIADYFFNYINARINKTNSSTFDIVSNISLKPINLTIKTSTPTIYSVSQNKIIHGIRKNGLWIFNGLGVGQYRIV